MDIIKKANQDEIRVETDLRTLTELLQQSFSFDHKTITEARKTINTGIYSFTFDATTLFPYIHNLNRAEINQIDEMMRPFYLQMDRETYKELCERIVLLRFLLCAPEQYQECIIEKHTRPDFVLSGNKRIGVEVTELTTAYDKSIFSLARQIEENGYKTKEEIEQHILRYFKKIANRVEILQLTETPNISSDFHCLDPKRIHFAEEIKAKYEKYKEEIRKYDEFIILANAASGSGLEISEQDDVQDVINHLLAICPDIINVTTVIAWREADHQETIKHTWYMLTK